MKTFLVIVGVLVALYFLAVHYGCNPVQLQFTALALLGVIIAAMIHFWWITAIAIVLYLVFR